MSESRIQMEMKMEMGPTGSGLPPQQQYILSQVGLECVLIPLSLILRFLQIRTTPREVWLAFTISFESQSKTQVIQVWSQLSTARKTNHTTNEYFMHIKRLDDNLAIAGQLLKNDDIITYLLAIFWSENDLLVTAVSICDHSLTLKKIYSILLTCNHSFTLYI